MLVRKSRCNVWGHVGPSGKSLRGTPKVFKYRPHIAPLPTNILLFYKLPPSVSPWCQKNTTTVPAQTRRTTGGSVVWHVRQTNRVCMLHDNPLHINRVCTRRHTADQQAYMPTVTQIHTHEWTQATPYQPKQRRSDVDGIWSDAPLLGVLCEKMGKRRAHKPHTVPRQ